MGRVIITIDEILAGRGLQSNKATTPASLEVFCGRGLEYGDDDDTAVKAGHGLGFDADLALVVEPSHIAGCGLCPSDCDRLDIDPTPDPAHEQTFRVVTDAKFRMDGYSLVFCTTHTTYTVRRNCAGVVMSVEPTAVETECQPLHIGGYGYGGYASSIAVAAAPGRPCFYAKNA